MKMPKAFSLKQRSSLQSKDLLIQGFRNATEPAIVVLPMIDTADDADDKVVYMTAYGVTTFSADNDPSEEDQTLQ